MLRRRSRLVARHSLRVTGQAADVRLSSRSVKQVFKAVRNVVAAVWVDTIDQVLCTWIVVQFEPGADSEELIRYI